MDAHILAGSFPQARVRRLPAPLRPNLGKIGLAVPFSQERKPWVILHLKALALGPDRGLGLSLLLRLDSAWGDGVLGDSITLLCLSVPIYKIGA